MSDVALQMTSMLAARTQGLAQIKMLKAEHQMAMQLVEMVAEVAKSAPPPGQGTRVDKTA